MEWVLLGLAGLGAATWGGIRIRGRLEDRRERAEALAQVVRLCDEDATLLGEQLRRLDAETAEHALDEAGRVDYQAALDSYESAQRELGKVREVDQVTTVINALTEGRYSLACVQASVAGEPRPEKRTTCFFNPQHGPSVTDVMFTPRAAGTRLVPACAQDAARVNAGEKPEIRKVEVNGDKVDYFNARSGEAYGGQAMWAAIMVASGPMRDVDRF